MIMGPSLFWGFVFETKSLEFEFYTEMNSKFVKNNKYVRTSLTKFWESSDKKHLKKHTWPNEPLELSKQTILWGDYMGRAKLFEMWRTGHS